MIIAQRHPELRDLCTWHTGGRKPSDLPYMKIMEAYFAEMTRVRSKESYLQNVDPQELKKLVGGEVVFPSDEAAIAVKAAARAVCCTAKT